MPTFDETIQKITAARERLGDKPMDERLEKRYRAKYALAERFAPDSICEIGVRAGYIAAVFMAARPKAQYLGIEINDQYVESARDILEPYLHAIFRVNSHRVVGFPQWFDMFHVDGDHTVEGCRADLELAAQHTDVILVDDFVGMPPVRAACYDVEEKWRGEFRGWLDEGADYKGTWIFERHKEKRSENIPPLSR